MVPLARRAGTHQPERTDARGWATRRFWHRLGIASLGVWLATAFGFVGAVVAARGLSVSGYGTVVAALAVATLIAQALDISLEEAFVHFGSRALQEGRPNALRALAVVGLGADVLIGVIVAGVAILSAGALADALGIDGLTDGAVRAAALVVLAGTIDGTTGAVLLLGGRVDMRGWLMACTALAKVVGVCIAVAVGGPVAVLLAFAAGAAVGGLVQLTVAWRVLRTLLRTGSGDEPAPSLWRSATSLLRFGMHSSVTSTLVSAYATVIPLVIGRMSTAHEVALYQVATLPLTAGGLASAPLRMALLPEFARLYAAGALQALRNAVRTYVRVAAALGAVGVAVGWLLLPQLVVMVFGSDYARAGRIGRVVLVAAALEMVLGWGKLLVPAAGRPQLRSAVAAIQLALVVSVLVWLGGDAKAGVTAVTVTSAAGCLLWWLVYRQVMARPPGVSDPVETGPR